MKRILLAAALCGLLCPAADAGPLKNLGRKLFGPKAPCGTQAASCEFQIKVSVESTSAPAVERGVLSWIGRGARATVGTAAGVLSCPNGNCRRK